MADETSGILGTGAARALHRRSIVEEQTDRQKELRTHDINKRYIDLKNRLETSTPLQIIRDQVQQLDMYYDNLSLESGTVTTVEEFFTIRGYRRAMKHILGIFKSIETKADISEQELIKAMESMKVKLDADNK